jgi:transcriptional regulator with XRE-family HTH domain
MNNENEPLGLRELRRLAGLTQTKAGRASGINHAKLSLAETGEVTLSAEEETRLRRALLARIRERAARIETVLPAHIGSRWRRKFPEQKKGTGPAPSTRTRRLRKR